MKTQIKNTVEAGKTGSEFTQSFGMDLGSLTAIITSSYVHNNGYRGKDFTTLEVKQFSKWWLHITVREIKEDTKGNLRCYERGIEINKEHAIQLTKNILSITKEMEDRSL